MPIPADWGIMTDKERAAWKARNAPSEAAKPKPATPPAADPIADIYARKGGYIRSPRGGDGHTEHR